LIGRAGSEESCFGLFWAFSGVEKYGDNANQTRFWVKKKVKIEKKYKKLRKNEKITQTKIEHHWTSEAHWLNTKRVRFDVGLRQSNKNLKKLKGGN